VGRVVESLVHTSGLAGLVLCARDSRWGSVWVHVGWGAPDARERRGGEHVAGFVEKQG
jgi:hypothetical protein